MRIGTLHFGESITADMLKAQSRMAEAQMQIASGRRIQVPSDDPSGAKTILDTEKFIATNEQYQDNIKQVRSRLELEETVMANMGDMLQRMRELTVQGSSDIYSAQERGFIADEIEELLGQMVSLANTRDSNDEYLFSGFSRQTKPFSDAIVLPASNPPMTFNYSGDQGERLIPIASDRKVADAENGYQAFFGLTDAADGTTPINVFDAAYRLAATLRDPASVATDFDNALTNIDNALDKVVEVRSKAGARLANTEQQERANEDFILHFETQLSQIKDLDYAEAITRFNREQVALQAAQQSYVKIQGLSLFNYL